MLRLENNVQTVSVMEGNIKTWLDELFPSPNSYYIFKGHYSWLRSPNGYPLELDFMVHSEGKILFAIDIIDDNVDPNDNCSAIKTRYLKYLGIPMIRFSDDPGLTRDDFVQILSNNNINYMPTKRRVI